jgi:hypothetical protein
MALPVVSFLIDMLRHNIAVIDMAGQGWTGRWEFQYLWILQRLPPFLAVRTCVYYHFYNFYMSSPHFQSIPKCGCIICYFHSLAVQSSVNHGQICQYILGLWYESQMQHVSGLLPFSVFSFEILRVMLRAISLHVTNHMTFSFITPISTELWPPPTTPHIITLCCCLISSKILVLELMLI